MPNSGLGAVVKATAADWCYAMAGVGDAQASATQTGLKTAFHDEDYAFSVYELGLTPKLGQRQGNYRFIFWYDPQPVERIDGGGFKRDDTGFALSFDQEVSDQVTLFFRYGFAHEQVREISNFWSFGAQLAKPLTGRDNDVFGLAVSQAVMGRDFRREEGSAHIETLSEAYYNIWVNRFVAVSPLAQLILNPGAQSGNDATVVAGARVVVRI